MQPSQHNDIGPAVLQIQTTLNLAGPSRLPRLPVDGTFGALTVGRAMEFQFQNHLTVDGVVGPATAAKLPQDQTGNNQEPEQPAGRSILVNLFDGELTAFEDGKPTLNISPVIGGRPGFLSSIGVFPMTPRRLREHSSGEFPSASGKRNMDFSLFYHGGEAIHQGNPNTASHGCVHVGPPFAERLFDWAGNTDIWVIVMR
jgi:Putative peptidoglycan binding domain/L,D-transpeptidase catalytic domain